MIVITITRKPLDGTVAANALEYGCGGLNIDGTRIGTDVVGRWPANMILCPEVAMELDVQSGESTSSNNPSNTSGFRSVYVGGEIKEDVPRHGYADTGGASRFFKVLGGSE